MILGTISEPHRFLSDIPGYEQFTGYAVGRSGAVYSLKTFRVRKLKLTYSFPGVKNSARVRIMSGTTKKAHIIYIRGLVSRAFILTDRDPDMVLKLKDPSKPDDLGVDNLHYVKKKKSMEYYTPKEIELEDDLIEELKKLYQACLIKRIPNLPDNVNGFVQVLIKEGINDYVSQKGLRKILYQL